MATLVEPPPPPLLDGEQPAVPVRKSTRIQRLVERINPARVVALLAEYYGLSHEEPSFEDQKLFKKIIKLIPNQNPLIEEEELFCQYEKPQQKKRKADDVSAVEDNEETDADDHNQTDGEPAAEKLTTEIDVVTDHSTANSPAMSDGAPASPPMDVDDPESPATSDECQTYHIVYTSKTNPKDTFKTGIINPNLPILPTGSNRANAFHSTQPKANEDKPPKKIKGFVYVDDDGGETSTAKRKPEKPRPQIPNPYLRTCAIPYISGSSSEEEDIPEDDSPDYVLEKRPICIGKYRNRYKEIDPELQEQAYRFWTKQDLDLSVPLVVDANLLNVPPLEGDALQSARGRPKKGQSKKKYANEKIFPNRISFKEVLAQFKFADEHFLKNYHYKLLKPHMYEEKFPQINEYVYQKYRELLATEVIVQNDHFFEWAQEAKERFDPENKSGFRITLDPWLKNFKKVYNINLFLDQKEKYRKPIPKRVYNSANKRYDEQGFRIYEKDEDPSLPRLDRNMVRKIEDRLVQRYNLAVERKEIVTMVIMQEWARQFKKELDPQGRLLFEASPGFISAFKQRYSISLNGPLKPAGPRKMGKMRGPPKKKPPKTTMEVNQDQSQSSSTESAGPSTSYQVQQYTHYQQGQVHHQAVIVDCNNLDQILNINHQPQYNLNAELPRAVAQIIPQPQLQQQQQFPQQNALSHFQSMYNTDYFHGQFQ